MSTAGERPRRGTFQVEREESWRMWALFAALLALVFIGIYALAWVASLVMLIFIPVQSTLRFVTTWLGALELFATATILAALYWYGARRSARDRLVTAMHAQPLDSHDAYHQRLANIAEEMCIAGGAPRIECLVVPTVGMNAFAFSNLKGECCIGVTEGTLSRLSRQQLEGVVAHEVAHILSGSYVTVTVACLLFGIYSSWGESLDKVLGDEPAGGAEGAAGAIGVVALLMRGVLAVLQLASTIVNAAISRTREQEADLAAARFTRDPVSLAEALRTISRHPGGGGFIPPGLAPLCIRASQPDSTSWLDRLFATHPPTVQRIAALLSLAHVGRAEFESQAAKADESSAGREHVATAPGARPQVEAGMVAALGGAVLGGAALSAAAATATAQPAGLAVVHTGVGAQRCPVCAAALQPLSYEGATVLACRTCGGRLVGETEVGRIIARREMGFTAGQERIADQVFAQGNLLRRMVQQQRAAFLANLVTCPTCGRTMTRRHYNYAYAVAVDVCEICGVFWFDKDELEVLQILIERQIG
jgi:Zn-dependent protease with chaperone function/Zn-finger nucleic acid-binding protein